MFLASCLVWDKLEEKQPVKYTRNNGRFLNKRNVQSWSRSDSTYLKQINQLIPYEDCPPHNKVVKLAALEHICQPYTAHLLTCLFKKHVKILSKLWSREKSSSNKVCNRSSLGSSIAKEGCLLNRYSSSKKNSPRKSTLKKNSPRKSTLPVTQGNIWPKKANAGG